METEGIRRRNGGEGGGEIFHILVHFASGHSSQVWGNSKPGARNSLRPLSLPSQQEAGLEAEEQDTDWHFSMACLHPKWQINSHLHNSFSKLVLEDQSQWQVQWNLPNTRLRHSQCFKEPCIYQVV